MNKSNKTYIKQGLVSNTSDERAAVGQGKLVIGIRRIYAERHVIIGNRHAWVRTSGCCGNTVPTYCHGMNATGIFSVKAITFFTFLLIILIAYAFMVKKSSIDARFDDIQKSKGLMKYLAALGQETVKVLPDSMVAPNRAKVGALTAKIRRAGTPFGIGPVEFNVLRIGCIVAGVAFGVLAWFACKDYIEWLPSWVIIATFGLLGWWYPGHWLTKLGDRREHAFRKELPEALDLLVISTSVSNSIGMSIQKVTPLLKDGIVKDEFELVSKDLSAGRSVADSLTNMSERSPSPDIEAFVNAVIQAQSTGTDMSDTLRRRSKTSRQEYIAMLDTKIASLESKIMMMLTPTMVMALTLVAIAPSMTTIFGSLGGM